MTTRAPSARNIPLWRRWSAREIEDLEVPVRYRPVGRHGSLVSTAAHSVLTRSVRVQLPGDSPRDASVKGNTAGFYPVYLGSTPRRLTITSTDPGVGAAVWNRVWLGATPRCSTRSTSRRLDASCRDTNDEPVHRIERVDRELFCGRRKVRGRSATPSLAGSIPVARSVGIPYGTPVITTAECRVSTIVKAGDWGASPRLRNHAGDVLRQHARLPPERRGFDYLHPHDMPTATVDAPFRTRCRLGSTPSVGAMLFEPRGGARTCNAVRRFNSDEQR